ncbi:hypothetical protein [uncultured Mediterranean phage]|nr:hypothetical protein [uncultured Mediterranean phage]
MAYQSLGLGTTGGDGLGDTLRVGGDKINDNFSEIYTLLGDGTDLSSGISATASVITLTSPTITTPTITEIDSGSTITLDATTDIVLDADGGDIFFKDAGTTFGSATNTSGNLIIKSGTTTAATFSGANVTFAGTVASTGVLTANAGVVVDNITIDGTEIDLSSGDLEIDVAGDITLNADGGDWNFNDDTASILKITNSSGDVIFKPTTDAKDIIFQQYDGTEVARIEDGVQLNVSASTASSSTTTGALIVGGGAGIAADLSVGDDINLLSDGAQIYFGANSEVTVTHAHNAGLEIKHTATADDNPVVLTLATGETDIQANDVLGSIRFQAPDEGTGTDAILVAGAIDVISEGNFSATNNASKMAFRVGSSETASEKMSLSSAGLLTIADDFVIKDGGTIGSDSAKTAITVASTGIVTFVDDILIKDGGTIGVASAADALTLSSAGLLTVKDDLVIKSGGTIGGAGDTDLLTLGSAVLTVSGALTGTTTINASTSVQTPLIEYTDGDDAMTIADGGGVTFAQAPTFPDGSINIRDLDIDGAAATSTLADADLFIIDDGAGGTNNKMTASNVRTYMGFGSGTVMLFHQSSAPTGWTKLTATSTEALADAGIRVIGTTSFNAGVNGTVAFETAFASHTPAGNIAGNTAATTLSLAQIPAHTHTVNTAYGNNKQSGNPAAGQGGSNTQASGSAGGGGSHTHGVGNFAFSGNAIDLDVKFVDVILASKD